MHSLPGPDSMAPALSSEQRGFAMQLRVSKKNILILALAFLRYDLIFFCRFCRSDSLFRLRFCQNRFRFLIVVVQTAFDARIEPKVEFRVQVVSKCNIATACSKVKVYKVREFSGTCCCWEHTKVHVCIRTCSSICDANMKLGVLGSPSCRCRQPALREQHLQ